MKSLVWIGLAVLSLAACREQTAEERILELQPRSPLMAKAPEPSPQPVARPVMQDRFSVARVQRFNDTFAYNGERGIYIIKDSQTGAEYIGISGIGITEVARHNCGKACSRADER